MTTIKAQQKWQGSEWRDIDWYVPGFEDYVYWMNLGLVCVFSGTHAVRLKK